VQRLVFQGGQTAQVRKRFAFSTIQLQFFFKLEAGRTRRSLANRFQELDADQLDIASFLATLNLGLNRWHSRGDQG
jgi:hypothetical protein